MALDYDIEPALPPHAHSAIPSRASKGPTATAEYELPPASSPEKKWHESAAWKKVQDRIPAPITRHVRRAVCWLKGGEAPKTNIIAPVFARIQTAHSRQFARLPQLARACLFICAFMIWLVVFGVVLSKNSLPSDIGAFGAPVRLSCTARLWPSAQSCGLDGRDCLPFDNSSFAFACPAACAGVQVLNPYPIGNTSIIYRSLVVGGAPDGSENYGGR